MKNKSATTATSRQSSYATSLKVYESTKRVIDHSAKTIAIFRIGYFRRRAVHDWN